MKQTVKSNNNAAKGAGVKNPHRVLIPAMYQPLLTSVDHSYTKSECVGTAFNEFHLTHEAPECCQAEEYTIPTQLYSELIGVLEKFCTAFPGGHRFMIVAESRDLTVEDAKQTLTGEAEE